MSAAYEALFTVVLLALGILLFLCLLRAALGPRVADRVVGVNMTGTIVIAMVAVLALMLGEGYLIDIAIIYAMLSFLAVVLLVKIYVGVYRARQARAQGGDAKSEPGLTAPRAAGEAESEPLRKEERLDV